MTKPLVTCLTALAAATSVFGQGTVVFNNRNALAGIDAKILGPDGVGVSGPIWKADLIAGPAGTALSALVPVPNSTTTFRTVLAAGYVNSITVTIPNIRAGAVAMIAVRAYHGNAYESASCSGTSIPITIQTGNPTDDVPRDLVGLQGFTVCIPEPLTYPLGILGAAGLLLWPRRCLRSARSKSTDHDHDHGLAPQDTP